MFTKDFSCLFLSRPLSFGPDLCYVFKVRFRRFHCHSLSLNPVEALLIKRKIIAEMQFKSALLSEQCPRKECESEKPRYATRERDRDLSAGMLLYQLCL